MPPRTWGQAPPKHHERNHKPEPDAPRRFALELERGNPAVVERILALLSNRPMRLAALRTAVGIKSRIHFNRYYLAPMLEKTLPDPA